MQYKMDLSEFSFNKIKAGRRVDMRLFDKKAPESENRRYDRI